MPEKHKKGWTRVAFGDVVKLRRDRSSNPAGEGFDRYVGLEHLEPGDLKIRRWGNVADGTTFTNVFRAGQVLFGKRRAYQRKVALADFDGVCSGDIYALEPKDAHLLAELLPFICQTDSFFDHAIGTSSGSLSPRTNWADLASYEFTLPPLEEQRRIAEVLLVMEGLVGAIQRALITFRSLTNAVTDLLILGSLSDLPIGVRAGLDLNKWKKANLGELCTLGNGHGFRPQDWSDRGLPIIRIQNVRGSKELNYFSGEPDPDWIVEPGELLFAWAGVPGVSFGPGIWSGTRGVLNQHIFRVTPQNGIERLWLYEVLRHVTPRIERRAHGFKHSLLHIRRSEFTSLQVLLPPHDQQMQIVKVIQVFREQEVGTEIRLQEANRMKRRFMAVHWG